MDETFITPELPEDERKIREVLKEICLMLDDMPTKLFASGEPQPGVIYEILKKHFSAPKIEPKPMPSRAERGYCGLDD